MSRRKQKFHKGDRVKVKLHGQELYGTVEAYLNHLYRVRCFGLINVGVFEEDLIPYDWGHKEFYEHT